MQNLTEKLELMSWLHSHGFEPAMWADGLHLSYKKWSFHADWEDDTCEFNFDSPWFPLEQVLELLPECIGKWQNAKEWEISQGWIRYFSFVINGDKKTEFEALASKDYHLAALRLLKQVVEQYPSEAKK